MLDEKGQTDVIARLPMLSSYTPAAPLQRVQSVGK